MSTSTSAAPAAAQRPPRLRFSHFGLSVSDIDAMERFYCGVLGFSVTDRGEALGFKLVFLSRNPDDHHQIVLATGKPANIPPNTVNQMFGPAINQISFWMDGLSELRLLHGKLGEAGVKNITPLNHGIAWSLYFPDPEGNNLECFVDTPWYMQQPFAEPLDMSLDDDTLLKTTHDLCRRSKGYRPYADWRAEIAAKMAARQAGAPAS
jgi:catechol-2,3-dioxygenase